jgi:hypothetical protein
VGDETLLPIRCCQQPFPIDLVCSLLPHDLEVAVKEKTAEHSTPGTDRLYCPNSTCSLFLGSVKDVQGGRTSCRACLTQVCGYCKQRAHDGESCTDNAALDEVKAIARTERWQTCPGCHAIVELAVGCYHITCRCRTEFCYICANRWKTCACDRWDENRLMNAAVAEVVDEGVRVNAPGYRQAVVRVAERLRREEECARHKWDRRGGAARCQACNHRLPFFLLVSVRIRK